jgi:uncharacterized protein
MTVSVVEFELPHPSDRRRRVRGRMGRPAGAARLPAVLLVHGYFSGKDLHFFPDLERELRDAGLATFSFDLSGSGLDASGAWTERACFAHNTYAWELEDTLAVLAFARAQAWVDGERLALFGHSRGAAVATVAAVEEPHHGGPEGVRALCLWSAPARVGRYEPQRLELWRRQGWLPVLDPDGQELRLERDLLDDFEPLPAHYDLLRQARRFEGPVLLVRGARDRAVGADETGLLAAAFPRAEVEEVAGAGHNLGSRLRGVRTGSAGMQAPGPEPRGPQAESKADARLQHALARTRAWLLETLFP